MNERTKEKEKKMKFNCSPKDWKKGQKIIIIVCIVMFSISIILTGLALIMVSEEEDVIVNEEPEVISDSNIDFVGENYKPVTVYDETRQEKSLEEYSEGPLAIIFFNNTVEDLEILNLYREYEATYSDKVTVLGIYVPQDPEEDIGAIKEELAEKDIYLSNMVFDLDYSANNEYRITALPSLVFINKNGEIINTVSSDITQDMVNANFDILAENY